MIRSSVNSDYQPTGEREPLHRGVAAGGVPPLNADPSADRGTPVDNENEAPAILDVDESHLVDAPIEVVKTAQRPAETNAVLAGLVASSFRWGDGPRYSIPLPLSPYASAAAMFSLIGFGIAVFSFWWPAMVIAPLAFGPGMIFAYLAFADCRAGRFRGSKLATVGWVLGFAGALVWNFAVVESIRLSLQMAHLRFGFDLGNWWLLLLIALGCAHLVACRARAASAIAVCVILLTPLATLLITSGAHSRRDAHANVAKKRFADTYFAIVLKEETGRRSERDRNKITREEAEEIKKELAKQQENAERIALITKPDEKSNALWWWLIGSCAAALLGFVGLAVFSQHGARALFRDATMSNCGRWPNCVSSKAGDSEKLIEAIRFDCSPSEAFDRLVLAISAQRGSRVELLTPGYVNATFRSPLFRFVDDAEFRIDAEAGVIHCRAAARVGFSDFGKNRKRLEAIRSDFAADYLTV